MKKTLLAAVALLLGGAPALAQNCPEGETEVVVSIWTDAYGNETTWTLSHVSGTPQYASGGPYSNQSYAGSFAQTPVAVCIPNGTTVRFKINDQYGDGLCCAYGDGNYEVKVDGNPVVTYEPFGASKTFLFTVNPAPELDLFPSQIDLDEIILPGSTQIKGKVRNFGSQSVSSFQLGYRVDGGAPVTATINATLQAHGSYNFTHPTPWNATEGEHTLEVWTALSDGTPDGDVTNDTLSYIFAVATQSVDRIALMEEFTSSTCGPCYNLNVVNGFDSFLESMQANQDGSSIAAVKYQMNWPSPGNDPSYNSDGNQRKNYYGVTGIPDVFLEGKGLGNFTAAIFNAAANKPAFMDLDVSYTLNGTDISVTADVTPRFTGIGYKLYVAITEDYYHYQGAATPQKDYHFAMRKMLPSGNGTTLVGMQADDTITKTYNYTLVEGGPAQGNYHLWGTVDGITVVAFVQNTATKEIMQAAFATSPTVGVAEHNADQLLRLWPNPTNDRLFLSYGKALGGQATVELYDALGQRVWEGQRSFASAGQVQGVDVSNLQPGMYFVRLIADGILSTQRIHIVR